MPPPNIVLIVAHQMRADSLSAMGNPAATTPNLDTLARHGTFFERAYTQHAQSAPARAALWTGHYPGATGVRSESDSLREDMPNFASALSAAGYATATVGSLGFLGRSLSRDNSATAEFGGLAGIDDYHRWLRDEGLRDPLADFGRTAAADMPAQARASFGCMTFPHGVGHHPVTWIGREAIRFIQGASSPFFLYVGMPAGHAPYLPCPEWLNRIDVNRISPPPGVQWPLEGAEEPTVFPTDRLTPKNYQRLLRHYYAAIAQMDHEIGRILATLGSRGHTNNVVCFAADHGALFGERGLVHPRAATLLDARLRVPLIVSGVPGQRRDTRVSSLVELVDVFPTLLEAAGLRPNADGLGGGSLSAVLRGESNETRAAAYSEGSEGQRAVTGGQFKLVESPDDTVAGLFDLKADPFEQNDLRRRPGHAADTVRLSKVLRRLR